MLCKDICFEVYHCIKRKKKVLRFVLFRFCIYVFTTVFVSCHLNGITISNYDQTML